MQEPLDFALVNTALLDETRPFPPKLLYHFSAITPEETITLKHTWPQVKVERRRALLEDLEMLLEKDHLLIYDEVGKIGLHDSDNQVVFNAIRLLWHTEDKNLVPEYIRFLTTHPDEGVRAVAGSILGNFVYLGEVESIPARLLTTIEETLLQATQKDRSDLVRRRTLESLGYSSRDEVVPLIKSALAKSDPLWQESALFAMGRSADNQWDKYVLKHLDDEELSVRIAAIHAAGDLAIEKARTFLVDLLNEDIEDDELLSEVIWALSQIGGEGVRETLEGLQDKTDDPDVLSLIEDALDNLCLTEDASLFELMDVDLEDEEGDDVFSDLDDDLEEDDLEEL
jgi:HEAT repeat protein